MCSNSQLRISNSIYLLLSPGINTGTVPGGNSFLSNLLYFFFIVFVVDAVSFDAIDELL
jgi:hypothetical protein